ncbi:MAG: hypothetical protein IJ702_04495, partial [Fretibacterium sp.]|nr:hypothetical protein [Fretibacterium sp.]
MRKHALVFLAALLAVCLGAGSALGATNVESGTIAVALKNGTTDIAADKITVAIESAATTGGVTPATAEGLATILFSQEAEASSGSTSGKYALLDAAASA